MRSSRPSGWRKTTVPFGLLISLVLNTGWMPGANADMVPQKNVKISMNGFNLTGTYSTVGGQPTGVGLFKNGNAGEYPEGSCVPALIGVKNNGSPAGDIQITPYYDFSKDASHGVLSLEKLTTALPNPLIDANNLNQFSFPGTDLSTVTSFKTDAGGTINAMVSGPYSGQDGTGAPQDADPVRHYNILLQNVSKGETVNVLFCANLHWDASEYGGGAQMSVRTGEGGAENIGISATKLLILPKLTLTKVVDGGTATPDQWSFHVTPAVNGQSDYPIASGQDTVTIDNIMPDGTYNITESGPVDYQFQSGSGSNCSFSGSTASTTLYAAKPQQTATCIFTNEYVAPPAVLPKLTVNKIVVNDNSGTKQASDFMFFVDGNQVLSGEQHIYATGTHTVSETSDSGYTTTYGGDCDGLGQVSLAEGEVKTCTITNDDIYTATTATVVVIKQVINDNGGTKTPADFTMQVTGLNVSNPSFPGSSDGVTVTYDAGPYSVDEVDDPGYAKTIGDRCSGNLAPGGYEVCTITNDDIYTATTATLIVIKNVINDNGGTKVASDFTMNVSGVNPSLTSFSGFASGVSVTLDPGSYAVDENPDALYAKTLGADCSGTIAVGETKTCLVTNDDIDQGSGWQATTGTLTVIKQVVNDNGGTKTPADFTMTVNGTNPSLTSFPGSSDGVSVVLDAGSYSVNEEEAAGYAKTLGENCSGSIAAGETKTCTITNDDIRAVVLPKLTVTKVVVNDSLGTKQVSDFPLFVDGNPVTSGEQGTFSIGTHTVSETGDAGYNATWSGDCDSSGQVSLADSDIKTCTITNDDIYTATTGTLTVIKQVVNDNGGTKQSSDFTITVSGNDPSPASFAGSANGTVVTLKAGSYSVDENTDPDYAKTLSETCSGSISAGQTITCLITNNDIQPWVATTGTLMVIKEVINDNGGTKVPGDFTMTVSGNNPSMTSFSGFSSGVSVTLDAGDYAVDEITDSTYAKTLGQNCSGTIAAGETKTCIVTNNDIYQGGNGGQPWQATTGTLTVIKQVVNDNGGTKQSGDFTMNVSGNNPSPASFAGSANGTVVVLEAGAYSVDENAVSDYTKTLSETCSGSIVAGQSVTCTVTNNDIQKTADLSLTKTVGASTVQTGSLLDYHITLTNIGPDPATNAQVQDLLPTGFIYYSSTASQGSYDSSSGVWTVGSMAVNGTATLDLRVTVTVAAGQYVNTASTTALEYDPVHSNNTASQRVTVTSPPSTGGGSSGGGVAQYIYITAATSGNSLPPPVEQAVVPTTPLPHAPTYPHVLGATDVAPTPELTPEPVPTPPAPKVLGAVDELPRTGLPAYTLLLAASGLAFAWRRKK